MCFRLIESMQERSRKELKNKNDEILSLKQEINSLSNEKDEYRLKFEKIKLDKERYLELKSKELGEKLAEASVDYILEETKLIEQIEVLKDKLAKKELNSMEDSKIQNQLTSTEAELKKLQAAYDQLHQAKLEDLTNEQSLLIDQKNKAIEQMKNSMNDLKKQVELEKERNGALESDFRSKDSTFQTLTSNLNKTILDKDELLAKAQVKMTSTEAELKKTARP